MARRLDALCEAYPEDCKLLKTHRVADGINKDKIDWKLYDFNPDYIQVTRSETQ